MLKRVSWKFALKRHRYSRVEKLPHDLVELILERLSVASLVKLKSVCKKWKSSIELQRFQERQLIRRRQSRGEDIVFVSIADVFDYEDGRSRIVLGSSVFSTVRFPISSTEVCHSSCDGLLCLSHIREPGLVINPATGWHRSFPHSSFQQLLNYRLNKREYYGVPYYMPGFGKDKLRGTYKPVWLYNSSELGLDKVTTCEVFDFGTNAWRHVLPASPYRIIHHVPPVYLDGSLYWLTESEEIEVLSFDLHTETFQVISKTPLAHVCHHWDLVMSVLDNRLCISEKNFPTQVIWLLGGNKTWEKVCSIDLTKTFTWMGKPEYPLMPVAILEKNKLLLHGRGFLDPLVPVMIHDLHTKSYDLLYRPTTIGHCVCYFQSLLTA